VDGGNLRLDRAVVRGVELTTPRPEAVGPGGTLTFTTD
jgi:hypothetical protein